MLEQLRIELGLLFYPFQLSYTGYGNWVLNCWLKRIWEKVDYVGVNVSVNNLLSTFPHKGDDWLMARVVALGYQGKNLITLNRVWNHQQVISLSDILSVGGGSVDTHYLKKRRHCKSWSTLKFPREEVSGEDMHLWQQMVTQVVSAGPSSDWLGALKNVGKK